MASEVQFLRDVLVWPGDPSSPGWINLHVNVKRNNGETTVVGWPYKTLSEFTKTASWIDNSSKFFNTWMCMSQQSECGEGKNGKKKAFRRTSNATWVKAIWVDVDVKVKPATWDAEHPGEPWTHYETFTEAWSAMQAFFKEVGLPAPSAVVNSGGGLHIYWISDKPLSPEEWWPYADGLKALLLDKGIKCDAGLTTDIVRLLRVPGTLNHKYTPPQKVALLTLGTPYSFVAHLPFLKNFKTSNSPKPAASSGPTLYRPDPAFAALDPLADTLQAGIDLTPQLVDPRPIFSKCAFLGNALKTGGKDYSNPLWHLSVVCTAFMENGHDIAHKVSSGHPTYDQARTTAEFDRAMADRRDRGVGYPSCAAIKSAGCKDCAGCPLFEKGKSPLNIRPVAVTAPVTAPAQKQRGKLTLPGDYDINVDGKICLIVKKTVKGEYREEWHELFHNVIDDARVFKGPDTIRLHISKDKGHSDWVTFKLEDLIGQGVEKVLVKQGMLPAANSVELGKFFMSFMSKMWTAQAAQPQAKFGWYRVGGKIEGFSCGGTLFKTDGTEEAAGINDPEMMDRYTPVGDTKEWHNTASYILRQERDDFDAIIAYSFGASLMEFTGSRGGIFASMGEKGAGKSYALNIAAAVWGNPGPTIERKDTTPKSMLDRMGKTNSLPAAWDEVTDPPVQQRMYDVMQTLSGGSNGGRLNSNITQQARLMWTTIININGNNSFRDYVITKQKNHGAGLRRLLEYWSPKNVSNPKGQVPGSEAKAAEAALYFNYGGVGQQYAKYIAVNHAQVEQRVQANLAMFDKLTKADKEEDYWIAMCACILTGAELANELPEPVGFRLHSLKQFLLDVFLENRQHIAGNAPSQSSYAENYLAQYFKDRLRDTIWTKGYPSGRGRSRQFEFRRVSPNAPVNGIQVHIDEVGGVIYISKPNFEEWCLVKPEIRHSYTIIKELKRRFNMVEDRKTLGAGTPLSTTQEQVLVLRVAGFPELEALIMETHPNNSALGVPAGVTVEVKEAAELA